jgi:tetratricopeptide (TPR) repeat protein
VPIKAAIYVGREKKQESVRGRVVAENDQVFAEVTAALRDGRLDQARDLLEARPDLSENPRWLYLSGFLAVERGEADAAIALLPRALQGGADRFHAYFALARAHALRGERLEAGIYIALALACREHRPNEVQWVRNYLAREGVPQGAIAGLIREIEAVRRYWAEPVEGVTQQHHPVIPPPAGSLLAGASPGRMREFVDKRDLRAAIAFYRSAAEKTPEMDYLFAFCLANLNEDLNVAEAAVCAAEDAGAESWTV